MKIAIVNRHPDDVLGGSEMQCDNIATELHNRGHDVIYIAPGGDSSKDYRRPYPVVPTVAAGREIAHAVAEIRPDIVYWRMNRFHFLQAARRIHALGVPIVFAVSHIDDTKRFTFLANPRSGPLQALRAVKQVASSYFNYFGFRYVSGVSYLNEDFLGRLPISPSAFVPNSVDETTTPFEWPRPYVAWVANIKMNKRPEFFYRLAEELSDRGVDFLMVGAMMSRTHDWLTEDHADKSFYHLGPMSIEQVNGFLAGSLLMVHTCRPEGFGNNFLQAWLKSKATVSLGFDPCGYIEKYGLGGVAHDDWERFVSIVGRYIADPEFAQAAGSRAYQFARHRFSKKQTVDALLNLIKLAISKNRQSQGDSQ